MQRACLAAVLYAVGFLCPVAAQEVCFALNPESAIDRRFLAELRDQRVPYKQESSGLACVPPAVRQVASQLRDKVHTELPQQCVSFDDKSSYPALRRVLRAERVENWMDKPEGPLCYLLSDAIAVQRVIKKSLKPKS